MPSAFRLSQFYLSKAVFIYIVRSPRFIPSPCFTPSPQSMFYTDRYYLIAVADYILSRCFLSQFLLDI